MNMQHNDVTLNGEASLSWKKIERDNKNTGFREGISDGKEKSFQEGFNEGYRDGFLNGFHMGTYKGLLKITSMEGGTVIQEDSLQHTRRGLCCICQDSSLTESSIQKIRSRQQDALDNVFKSFGERHSNVVLK